MSPRGTRQKPIIYKVLGKFRNVSPDDVKARLLLRDQLQAQDTRDAAASCRLIDDEYDAASSFPFAISARLFSDAILNDPSDDAPCS